MDRTSKIVRTSLLGIAANILLAGFKAAAGLVSGSIAIVMDAVNNLSDALSSLITLIGARIAARKPDKKHPFGHGRVEYLTATVIAIIVLYAGVTSMVESVRKIINPQDPEYQSWNLIVIAAAVVVKVLLGRHVKKTGEMLDSASLQASGKDALMDAVISASTLLAAFVFIHFGVSLEAWLAAVISLFILRTGWEILTGALSDILGSRVDPELSRAIKQTILGFDGVHGVYDLVVTSYGPEKMIASVHIAVDDTMTADVLDKLQRDIAVAVLQNHGVIVTGVSVYSVSTKNPEYTQMLDTVMKIVSAHPDILQLHGFYVDPETKQMGFDLVVSFDAPSAEKLLGSIKSEVESTYPGYTVNITQDYDVSD